MEESNCNYHDRHCGLFHFLNRGYSIPAYNKIGFIFLESILD